MSISLQQLGACDGATATVVCFPPAGGAVTTFAPLRPLLPSWVRLVAVRYPGHLGRHREPCATDLGVLADEAAADLVGGDEPGPVVLLGHSMGAVVAYEVARRVPPGAVDGLVVSGQRAPRRLEGGTRHLESDEVLWRVLVAQGGVPPELVDDAGLRALVVPTFRADLRLVEAYRAADDDPLGLPVRVYRGYDDAAVTGDDVAGWAAVGGGGQAPDEIDHVLDGGHFAAVRDPGPMVAGVVALLRDAQRRRASSHGYDGP